jgi:hypothetical protein
VAGAKEGLLCVKVDEICAAVCVEPVIESFVAAWMDCLCNFATPQDKI